jgi:hypothetical protein
VVEIGKSYRPHSFRRCSGAGTPRTDARNKTSVPPLEPPPPAVPDGRSDHQTSGHVGFGTLPDPTS